MGVMAVNKAACEGIHKGAQDITTNLLQTSLQYQ